MKRQNTIASRVRLVKVQAKAWRAPVRGERPSAGVFVGREHELGVLRASFDESLAGRGQLVLLAGEPGIGKTRLADELATVAERRGARVLWGRCWEGEGAPAFWPWIQIVRARLQDEDAGALVAALKPAATDLAALIPEIRDRLSPVRPFGSQPTGSRRTGPALDPEQARFQLFDSVTSFLKRAALAQPLVAVLDDLHCADKASLLLLEFLVANLRDAHVLVVAAYRDTEVGSGHHLADTLGALGRHQLTQRLTLQGLSGEDVRRFILDVTGAAPHPSVVSAVHRETEGNPLFINELVGLLRAEGRIGAAVPPGSTFPLPPTVREVIGRRLHLLSPSCNEVLTAASVVGREFELPVLEYVTKLPADRLLELLDEALAARIVSQSPQAVGGYRFAHVMIRDALYEMLPPSRRVRLHREVARALETLYQTDRDPPLASLAYHFFRAAPAGEVEKAIDYAQRAGEHACNALAYEEATALFDLTLQALSLAGANEPRRFELLCARADALRKSGQMPAARETFLQGVSIARALGDATLLARAALGLGEPWASWGYADQVLIDALEGAHLALRGQESALHARVMAGLALALELPAGDERLKQLIQAALAMARRTGDRQAELFALFAQQNVGWPNDARERLALHMEILRVAEQLGNKEMVLQARLWRRCDLEELGDMRAADQELRRCTALAEQLRQPRYQWQTALARGMRALMRGQFADGERLITEAWELGRRGTEATVADEFAWMQLFTLRRAQGRLEELEPAITMAAEKYPTYIGVRVALAVMCWETGRAAEARGLVEELVTNASFDAPEEQFRLISLALLAELCAFLKETWRAKRLYELLQPYAGRNVIIGIGAGCEGSASRHLALLSTALADWEQAERHFREALSDNQRLHAPPLVARTQMEFARMLLLRADAEGREQALAHLASAVRVFEKNGMIGYAQEAVALQNQAHDSPALSSEPSDSGQPARCCFRCEGDSRTIGFGGRAFRLKDISGLRYIAQLLRHPGEDIHVFDLIRPTAEPEGTEVEGYSVRRTLGDAGVILDAKATAAYRERLSVLRAELAEAQELNDIHPRISSGTCILKVSRPSFPRKRESTPA